MNPFRIFKKAADTVLPRRHLVNFSDRHQPASTLAGLTVDRLQSAMRQAEAGDTRGLFAIYRDSILSDNYVLALLDARKRAALKDPVIFKPADPKNAEDAEAARRATAEFFQPYNAGDDEVDDWQLALAGLLDGVLWPCAVLSKRFAASARPGLRWDLAGLRMIDPQLFDYSGGALRIADTNEDGMRMETFHCVDAARYMRHQGHLMSTPGNWGGPMRTLLFWWLFAVMNRDWWVRFLDRFGAPFLKGSYESGDDQSKTELEAAFVASSRLLGVVVSKETDVEVVQATGGNATGEAFERFRDTARKELAIAILGQNLSTESDATGMNSGVANLQGSVLGTLTDFDQARLAMTLQRTVNQWLVINGIFGTVEVQFGGKAPVDLDKLGGALAKFSQAGLTISDESLVDLSDQVGFTMLRSTPAGAAPGMPPGAVPAGGAVDVAAGLPGGPAAARKALAGGQVQRAQQVLDQVTRRQTSPAVARRLLAALGFGEEEAGAMIDEAAKFVPATFSADPSGEGEINLDAAGVAAAKLARLFRESLAPVRRLIADAADADDLERRLERFFADLDPAGRATAVEELLVALAANGA